MSSMMPSVMHSPPDTSWNLLSQVRQLLTQKQLAARLQMATKTISRWEKKQTKCPVVVEAALREILESGSRSEPSTSRFTFIDLFAGIGGMRVGFERAGGTCVFSSEWNPWAQKTYIANFG